MTDKEQIQKWLNRFMAGATTEMEEQLLADYFNSATDVHEEWMPYAILFRGFQHEADGKSTAKTVTMGRWIAAAAAIVLLIAGGTMIWQKHFSQSEEECVAYIYGERTTDREVVLCEMQKTMTVVTYDGSDVVEEQLKSIFGIE
jgi:hypothetical protein